MITIYYETKNLQTENKITRSLLVLPVADPGFPRGRGANPARGPQHTPNFPQNCTKLKEFGPPGARPLAPP